MENNNRTECLCYTRTCGWLVPIKQMNKGKISEVKDRKTYNNKDFNKFIISTAEQLEELKELKEKISYKPTIKPRSKNKVRVKK